MYMMKRLLLGGSLVALSAGAAAAAPAVVDSGLNLRSGPGTGYAVIETLPAGARVDVTGCTGGWCRVVYDGARGYASREYLDVQSAAVVPEYEYYGPAYGYYGYYEPSYAYDYDYPSVGFAFGYDGHRYLREHGGHDRLGRVGEHREFGRASNPAFMGNRALASRPNMGAAHEHFSNRPMGGAVGARAGLGAHATVGAGAPAAPRIGASMPSGAPAGGGHMGHGHN